MILDVPLIPQSTNTSCWAASIAMVLSWRDSASYSPYSIAANHGGPSYMPEFNSNGLDPNDSYILQRNGFRVDAPQCYTPDLILTIMKAHGPLWVAAAVPTPHIRVAVGLDGGQIRVNDPWPVDKGAIYSEAFFKFFCSTENLGTREIKEPRPVYVAYLK